MKNFKKVIATFLSALMVTGSMACGASAVSTNQESNVKNKTKQTLIYPNKNDKKKKTYVEVTFYANAGAVTVVPVTDQFDALTT